MSAPLAGHYPTFPKEGGCDAICAECGVQWPDCRTATSAPQDACATCRALGHTCDDVTCQPAAKGDSR